MSITDHGDIPAATPVPSFSQTPSTPPPIILEDVLAAARRIGLFHSYVVEVALATYVSKELGKKNPLWLMLVGEPSSNKTELVGLLRNGEGAYMLDTMTANPFISGMSQKDNPQDLLPMLNGKCFIVKDYTSLFGMAEETVKKVISELVAIYDGEYSKHSGSRGTIRHTAIFSHMGCVTPSGLNMRQRYMNMVGARFLTLRIPALNEKEKEDSFDVAWDRGRQETAKEVAAMLTAFADDTCRSLRERGSLVAQPDLGIRKELNMLAEFTASARGEVRMTSKSFTDEEGKEVNYQQLEELQVERPYRALHQLRVLAEALAIIRGKEEVGHAEIETVKKVVLSSMPTHRAEVLSVFKTKSPITANEAKDLLDSTYPTTKRGLDELVHLKVLTVNKSTTPHQYAPHSSFISLICPPEEVL